MNIVQLQEQLKNFSQDQLVREMQMPSGTAPQFLVLGEIMRRQKMQQDFSAQQGGGQPQTTVAEDAIAAAGVPQGGIASMARALAPQTNMAGSTGVQAMATGGPVQKMKKGGEIVVRNGKRYIRMPDGTMVDEATGQQLNAYERMMLDSAEAAPGLSLSQMDALGPTAPRLSSFDARGPASSPMPDDGRTWGQRNVGDPLRSIFQPVGDYLKSVGEPIGAGAPQFILGPIPSESVSERPALFMPGAISGPVGAPAPTERARTALTYDQIVANARNGIAPTPDQLVAGVDAGILNTQQALDIQAMIESGYVPDQTEQRTASLAGMTPVTPDLYNPDTPYAKVTSGIGDFFAGALGGRTVGEQAEIDRKREEQAAEYRRSKGEAAPRADRDQQGVSAIPTAEEVAVEKVAAEKAAVEETAPTEDTTLPPAPPGGGSGGTGSSGGVAGLGGVSSYEQELIDALNRREKAAEQDKWLALAQVGLNLMASTQPTLAGALGEAGLKGVEAARAARDQYDKDRLDLMGSLEQLRMSRAAASAKAARGGGGSSGGIAELGLSAGEGRLLTQISADIDSLSAIVNDPYLRGAIAEGTATPEEEIAYKDAANELAAVRAKRRALLYGVMPTDGGGDDTNIDAADE